LIHIPISLQLDEMLGASNMPRAEISPASRRRLLADLKRLEEEPIPLAAASPCSDSDLTLWNGVIGAELDVTHFGRITVPLHFLIDFPSDYPNSAPSIGFSFQFQYRGGAEYVMPDGRLKGKKVICLDVLGNFGQVHSEWKHTVGSGWSPAYTVTTLLVQLQSVLCDLGTQMSQRERDVTYQSAMRFCEQNPEAVIPIMDEDEIRDRREESELEKKLMRICSGNEALVGRVTLFARRTGIVDKKEEMSNLLALLNDVASTASGSPADSQSDADPEVVVDTNICCWSTGKLYTEALLGVGVSRERRNIATAAELLSKEAYDGGLRQNTNKSPFEFFLPVWINEAHAASRPEWRNTLLSKCSEIGTKALSSEGGADGAVYEVFPRLINQMIVEMMKPDAQKSAAIALFEALCNFWRTFRWLVDTRPDLRSNIGKSLTRFVSAAKWRHKDHSPDLGALLVLFTVLQGHEACPSRQDFINAYADENSLRWVMWWKRAGAKAESVPVFNATQVSREILMFQMMVVDVVIGDVPETLKLMESTNCRLPERLETLQSQWRERKQSIVDWQGYFSCIGAAKPSFGSSNLWIADCVSRAESMGPKYASSSDGKGSKGKGKGKGGKY
jgi:ubiquitin-protein ligase